MEVKIRDKVVPNSDIEGFFTLSTRTHFLISTMSFIPLV